MSINKDFIKITEEFRCFLDKTKSTFDAFDASDSNNNWKNFIYDKRLRVFENLDKYFEEIWKLASKFSGKEYESHQKYFQERILPLIEETSEVNRQIYRKPLGYPGDYLVMNYIYDYSGGEKFLGKSTYEKLVNNYTCNIPFSLSNITRKEYFKNKIVDVINSVENVNILSVGSGPARELLEALPMLKNKSKASFVCLDLEKKALDHAKMYFDKSNEVKSGSLELKYLNNNVIDLIRKKDLQVALSGQDFIYASGLFDYLSNIIAKKLIRELFKLLKKNGSLVICNASLEKCSHRAYYQLLGEWNMYHRTKEELLSWVIDLKDSADLYFDNLSDKTNYLFLNIIKKI